MEIADGTGISFAEALRVKRGDAVSFVGGGGKTTSMLRLAHELSAAGFRVVATTSTHIAENQIGLFPAYVHPGEMDFLARHLDRHGQCLIAGLPDGKGRVFHISPDVITGLKSRPDVDCILIEADGSKSRPFKAPAAHEPVVLGITTILAPVAGMNCIGRRLDEATVHRPEIVASLTGARIGDPITPDMVARILAHPEGGAKGLPPGARLVPVLNKMDACDFQSAHETAEKLLAHSNVDSVLACSMNGEPPVLKAWFRKTGSAPEKQFRAPAE